MLARALPALITVALVGVIGSDVAVAVHMRALDRAAAAAAAEQRAVGVYRDRLRPLAERVYDEVQPMQDAVESYKKPGPDVAQIAEDVLSHSGVAQALTAQRRAVAKLPAPRTLRAAQGRVLGALDDLTAAAARLASTKTQADYGDFNHASTLLGSGISDWSDSLIAVYGAKTIPSQPVGGGTMPRKRPAAGRASLVVAMDRVCSSALDAQAGLPPADSTGHFVQAAPRYTKLMRSTVRGLSAAKVPPSQKARVDHDIAPNFARANKLADGIDTVMASSATGNLPAIRRGLDSMLVGMRGSQALSVALRSYGATVCADFFEIPAADIRQAEARVGGLPA